MSQHVADFIRALEPLDTCAHRGLRAVRLALAPAASPHPPGLAPRPLASALRSGAARVTEVGGGSVGELEIRNGAGALLFGMAGELVVGGRQDRVLNASVLIAPGAAARVAVSCVEQNRWDAEGVKRDFCAADSVASPAVRSTVHGTVVTSLRQTGTHHSDQRQVWQRVSDTLRRTGTHQVTPTAALTHGLSHDAARLESYVRACAQPAKRGSPFTSSTPSPEGRDGAAVSPQLGLALFTPGTPSAGLHGFTSLDCFATPELLAHYARRLVRGAALEALSVGAPTPVVAPSEATQMLIAAMAHQAPVVSRPAAGGAPEAQELHYELDGMVASVLCHQGRLVHIAMSPIDSSPVDSSPIDSTPIDSSPIGTSPLEQPAAAPPYGPGDETHPPGERIPVRLQLEDATPFTHYLSPGVYLLGRGSHVDIVLDHRKASRTHAELTLFSDGTATIRDLDSTHGVTVNGEPVVFSQINPGDRLQFSDGVALWLLRPA